MTGDGVPDLLTVGDGSTGVASGLWLSTGETGSNGDFDGTVNTTATDIAPYGPEGIGTANTAANLGTPANWDGLQAITGRFTGNGFNSIEALDPAKPAVYLLQGEGDGSDPANTQYEDMTSSFTPTFYVGGSLFDPVQESPLQLANAYDTSQLTPGTATPVDDANPPDQIGVYNDPNLFTGSTGSGFLTYFRNTDSVTGFDPYILLNTSGQLLPTPDGTQDWSSWTITTEEQPGAVFPDMLLWNKATGALDLWQLQGLTAQIETAQDWTALTGVNGTAELEFTPTQLAAGSTTTTTTGTWNQGATLNTLQATSINGNPGLIAVTSTGQAENWEDNSGTLTQVNSAGPDQQLSTADHTYLLDDASSGGAASAVDSAGIGDTATNLSQSTPGSQPTWNDGDALFSPDLEFNETTGHATDYMTTSRAIFNPSTTTGWTISTWVKPSALNGGTVWAQNGASSASVGVSVGTTGQWNLNIYNPSTASYEVFAGGTVQLGLWTDLVVAYNGANGIDTYTVYANGTQIANAQDTTAPGTAAAAGAFLLGNRTDNYFAGQIADVQEWNSVAIPVQPATPDSAYVPIASDRILDTRNTSTNDGYPGPIAESTTITLHVANNGGTTGELVSKIPAGETVTAVAAAITVDGGDGNVTVYPTGAAVPSTSTLNCYDNNNVTGDVIEPVSANGSINIDDDCPGTGTQFVVDVYGYFTTDVAAGSGFVPAANPARLFYTGGGIGVPKAQVPANGSLTVTLDNNNTNGAGLPASGITAVALNLEAIAPSGDTGYLEAYPAGSQPSAQSVVSFVGAQTYSNTVLVQPNSSGQITIFNGSTSPIDVVGDLYGYFTANAGTPTESYHTVDSTRLIDTRQTSSLTPTKWEVTIPTPASFAVNDPTLVLNITATNEADAGDFEAWPTGGTVPSIPADTGTSVLSFGAAENIGGLGLINTATGNDNSFNIGLHSSGNADVVVDCDGYFQ